MSDLTHGPHNGSTATAAAPAKVEESRPATPRRERDLFGLM